MFVVYVFGREVTIGLKQLRQDRTFQFLIVVNLNHNVPLLSQVSEISIMKTTVEKTEGKLMVEKSLFYGNTFLRTSFLNI